MRNLFRGRRWSWLACASKVLAIALLIAVVRPLRNCLLYPVFPTQWRTLGSFRLLRMHVEDFFYPMNLQPYQGPCDDVFARLDQAGILKQAKRLNQTFQIFTVQDWENAQSWLRKRNDGASMKALAYFRPALTEREQRELLMALFILTSTLEAFNVTYLVAEGTAIGALRHKGLIPWDDDADVIFRAEQWPTARRALSCVPGYRLRLYSDFMWKFFSKDSTLWKDETVTRFPYVDLFPYVQDTEYVWPLVIWMKDKMLLPVQYVFPTRLVEFNNFRVRTANNAAALSARVFGNVSTICQSRIFERRERKLMPDDERMQVDCRELYDVFPFYDQRGQILLRG